MAVANPLETFIWGRGGEKMTPREAEREREIANALMGEGVDTSPVGHWLQGAARVAQAGAGALRDRRADRAETAGRESASGAIAELLGGGGEQFPEAPAAPAAPETAMTGYAPGDVESAPLAAPTDRASQRVAQAHGDPSWLRYANEGATRNQPLNNELTNALGFLPELGVEMEVFSGGQPAEGEGPRVGSTRHDHGNAADVFFYKDGRKLDWSNPQDQPLFEEIVRRGRQAGVTGFGAGEGYMQPGAMHLGFGEEAVWGAGGSGENAPGWLRTAYNSPDGQAASPGQVQIAQAMGGPQNDGQAAQRNASSFAPSDAGLPETAAPGTVMRGDDGQIYQYAETTGMPGASGPQGWIRARESVVGPPQNAQMAQAGGIDPNDPSTIPAMAGGTRGTVQPGQSTGGSPGIAQLLTTAQNPWLSEGQGGIVNMLLEQQMQQSDPMRQLEMENIRSQIDARGQPDPTSSMRDYEYLVSQGVDPQAAMERAFSGGTTVNVGGGAPELGKLSSDYGYVLDEEGNPAIDPDTGLPQAAAIPGSPAAQEAEQAEQQRVGRQAEQRRAGVTVMREVGRAFEFLPQVSQGEGVVGANTRRALAQVAGTPEYQMQEQISSALANVGLDRLQQMRENSPTGGALGQVPFQQQKRLEQVLGGFDITQPPDILDENLRYLHNAYMDISYGAEEERERLVQEGKLSADENQRISEAYYDLDWDEFGRRRPEGGEQTGNDDPLGIR